MAEWQALRWARCCYTCRSYEDRALGWCGIHAEFRRKIAEHPIEPTRVCDDHEYADHVVEEYRDARAGRLEGALGI